jgi:hypothetical protein
MLGFMETPLSHFFSERSDPRTLDALTRGPLAAHLRTYVQQLHDQGYAVISGQSQLRVLGHFNRRLQSKGLAAEQVDSSTLERFRVDFQRLLKLGNGLVQLPLLKQNITEVDVGCRIAQSAGPSHAPCTRKLRASKHSPSDMAEVPMPIAHVPPKECVSTKGQISAALVVQICFNPSGPTSQGSWPSVA